MHNLSGWLNQKPRALLELWMLFAGLVVPLRRRFGRWRFARFDWREWINPAGLGISTCMVFLISKLLSGFRVPQRFYLGSSETREVLIACFLFHSLLSRDRRLGVETAEDRALAGAAGRK